jgi:hypothetical protein
MFRYAPNYKGWKEVKLHLPSLSSSILLFSVPSITR